MTTDTPSRAYTEPRLASFEGPYSCDLQKDGVDEMWCIYRPGDDRSFARVHQSWDEGRAKETTATAFLLTAAPQLVEALELLGRYTSLMVGERYMDSKIRRLVQEALGVAGGGYLTRPSRANDLRCEAEIEFQRLAIAYT